MTSPNKKGMKHLEHWQIIVVFLIVYDVIAVNMAYFLALWFRFDCVFSRIPKMYLLAWWRFAPVYTVLCIAVFAFARLYNSMWRYASFSELLRITSASLLTSVAHVVLINLYIRSSMTPYTITRMPVSYVIIGAVFQFFFVTAIRFSYRLVLLLRETRAENARVKDRVMLIGAGNAGQLILRDINNNANSHEKVVCIVDDNSNKWGRFMNNVPIVGGRDAILENVEKYGIEKIYLAIPSATAEQRRDILNIC